MDEEKQEEIESGPVAEIRPAPQKPLKTVQYALFVLIGLIAFVFVYHFLAGGSSSAVRSASVRSNGAQNRPQTAEPDAIKGFEAQQQNQVRQLEEQAKDANSALRQAQHAANVLDLAQRGQAAGMPTAAQQQGALLSGQQPARGPYSGAYGDSGVDYRAQERADKWKRARAALVSSTVAIDFSDTRNKQANSEVKPDAPEVSQQPEGSGEKEVSTGSMPAEKKVPYDFDSATGPLYRVFEGSIIETVLTNRVDGAFAGPVNCMVTTDVWSHDHQHLLIPQGSRVLGNVTAVGSTNQQRLFVAFHRIVMPDGYSVSLDKFTGLDVTGQTGLRDLVNHHYLSIFGASLAIGAVGGLAQIGNVNPGYGYDPSVSMRAGITQQMADESRQILNHFLNQLPTFVIRERSRVKVYMSNDLLLPSYDLHTMNPAL